MGDLAITQTVKKFIRYSDLHGNLRVEGDQPQMNFSFDSSKSTSKQGNENFYFDVAMPRSHFFAVLDFAAHDFTNLDAALRAKLETIVGSFSTLPDFSDDLFLGFLAKEINNFVSNLAQQPGDPDLPFSAALCLVTADRLSCFRAGDVSVQIVGHDRITPLETSAAVELGRRNLETPLTDQVQSLSLGGNDLVLIMTRGITEALDDGKLPAQLMNLPRSEPKLIADLLMKHSEATRADRTLVVISGPYEKQTAVASTDSSSLIAELKASVASLEARLNALPTGPSETGDGTSLEQRFERQIESLKDDLRSKSPAIDVLELAERVKGIDAQLASKANTADVLGLQRDVLKLGLTASPTVTSESTEVVTASSDQMPSLASESKEVAHSPRSFPVIPALILVILSLAAGFGGGWLQSRLSTKSPEVWSVKTAGNQIVISRTDGTNTEPVTLTLAETAKADSQQTFSSFADVKRYVDTLTSGAARQATQSNQPAAAEAENLTEITIKSGDSLKKLARSYNVPPEKLMELNPTITRWETVPIGKKIVVPVVGTSATSTGATSTPTPAPLTGSQPPANTAEITVGPGDSLNELARRFNTTAGKLRELNPNFNWQRIQVGQKVIVPASAG